MPWRCSARFRVQNCSTEDVIGGAEYPRAAELSRGMSLIGPGYARSGLLIAIELPPGPCLVSARWSASRRGSPSRAAQVERDWYMTPVFRTELAELGLSDATLIAVQRHWAGQPTVNGSTGWKPAIPDFP